MTERYFEDFAAGQVFRPSGRVRIDKEDIMAFAQKFDPQPFHLDEEAARHSMFGRLVASGWHTAALTMSLIARSDYRAAGGTIGLGFESLRWPMPVLPGDELRRQRSAGGTAITLAAGSGTGEDPHADAQPERRNGAGGGGQRHGAAAACRPSALKCPSARGHCVSLSFSVILKCERSEPRRMNGLSAPAASFEARLWRAPQDDGERLAIQIEEADARRPAPRSPPAAAG
jgi:acyl dehydratase